MRLEFIDNRSVIMNSENPFRAPLTAHVTAVRHSATPFWPVAIVSSVLVCIAVAFELLLNGQVYTNRLISIGLFGISAMLWLLILMTANSTRKVLTSLILVLHIALLTTLIMGLSNAHDAQIEFNAKTEKLR